MQGQQWDALLRRIPANYHDGLILVTINAIEIIVQCVIKAEEDYLIVRGRTSGTSDSGKIIVLPYDQLTYLSFKRSLTDPEVAGIFGNQDNNFAAMANFPATPGEEAEPVAEEEKKVEENNAKVESAPAASPVPAGAHSKSVLLAKLRARLSGDNGNNFKSK